MTNLSRLCHLRVCKNAEYVQGKGLGKLRVTDKRSEFVPKINIGTNIYLDARKDILEFCNTLLVRETSLITSYTYIIDANLKKINEKTKKNINLIKKCREKHIFIVYFRKK